MEIIRIRKLDKSIKPYIRKRGGRIEFVKGHGRKSLSRVSTLTEEKDMEKSVMVVTLDEMLGKAVGVKPYTRTKKGRMERVGAYSRSGEAARSGGPYADFAKKPEEKGEGKPDEKEEYTKLKEFAHMLNDEGKARLAELEAKHGKKDPYEEFKTKHGEAVAEHYKTLIEKHGVSPEKAKVSAEAMADAIGSLKAELSTKLGKAPEKKEKAEEAKPKEGTAETPKETDARETEGKRFAEKEREAAVATTKREEEAHKVRKRVKKEGIPKEVPEKEIPKEETKELPSKEEAAKEVGKVASPIEPPGAKKDKRSSTGGDLTAEELASSLGVSLKNPIDKYRKYFTKWDGDHASGALNLEAYHSGDLGDEEKLECLIYGLGDYREQYVEKARAGDLWKDPEFTNKERTGVNDEIARSEGIRRAFIAKCRTYSNPKDRRQALHTAVGYQPKVTKLVAGAPDRFKEVFAKSEEGLKIYTIDELYKGRTK